MSASVNWSNPYAARDGRWHKGGLHVHVSEGSGCSKMSFAEAADAYVALGFDFLSISDHFVLTEPKDDRLVLIPGMEWTGMNRKHTGIYSPDPGLIEQVRRTAEQDDAIRLLAGKNALTILNHPNSGDWDHYLREDLDGCGPFDGIEIYNALIEHLRGGAHATDKWDHVLTAGRRVLGFAGDDAHRADRVGKAWIMVRAVERTLDAIFAAISAGNFYCSSGVVFADIRREGDRISAATENAEEIRVIGSDARLLHVEQSDSVEFDLSSAPEGTRYARIEAFGYGSSRGWTQPFFLAEFRGHDRNSR